MRPQRIRLTSKGLISGVHVTHEVAKLSAETQGTLKGATDGDNCGLGDDAVTHSSGATMTPPPPDEACMRYDSSILGNAASSTGKPESAEAPVLRGLDLDVAVMEREHEEAPAPTPEPHMQFPSHTDASMASIDPAAIETPVPTPQAAVTANTNAGPASVITPETIEAPADPAVADLGEAAHGPSNEPLAAAIMSMDVRMIEPVMSTETPAVTMDEPAMSSDKPAVTTGGAETGAPKAAAHGVWAWVCDTAKKVSRLM
jgi:hypothetical protein